MTEQSTVLVVGATGSIGVHVVREALTRGRHVRALVRDASRAARVPEGAEIVIGDLTSAETLADAVAGVGSVVFVHGSHGGRGVAEKVDYGAVANVLTVLDGRPVRIALMTAVGTTDRANEGHDWKQRAERLVRASGNRYTVVRPGWFDYNAPDERHIVFRQGDQYSTASPADGVIARDQIARVLLDCLEIDAADHRTLELVAERGAAQEDLAPSSRRSSEILESTAHSTCRTCLSPTNRPPCGTT
ncbi:SDR family oxidoreductase [Microbacterium sp. STF-2]|uniref:SDR family oxidoreductase n=1 Tax=Microbacterium sp. STF-2 TaxID=3031132 RepID=UPI002AFE80B6|nr:SDR family oxidoreductase [Microbacterium sp. STF-2]MEA1262255.1 SDR family oxidoreductase [Microbacterium sp. STF-2]